MVSIVNGTGYGQTRLIFEYEGSTKTAIIDRNWKTIPDDTSEYVISAHAGREHVNEGLARGGTSTTLTLNALASPNNNAYKGQVIFIRSGTGEGQARRVIDYDGTTKIATVGSPFPITPDTTSVYVMLPTGTLSHKMIADAVLEATVTDYETVGTIGELLSDLIKLTGYKVTKSGDVITIYESDDATPWRQYNLASGGRVEV